MSVLFLTFRCRYVNIAPGIHGFTEVVGQFCVRLFFNDLSFFPTVGREETFSKDLDVIFGAAKLSNQLNSNLVQNRNRNVSKTQDEITFDFFQRISKHVAIKIYNYYELDFDMFGYDKIDALKFIEASYNE